MSTKHKTQDWFAEWFDSPYYHILYRHRNDTEAQEFIDNLLNFLQPGKRAKILDLACGKGRHSIYLNEKGFDVTGIDLSAKSIEQAKQFENQKLQFEVHDMRQVYMENHFDLVLNMFTSFGYFEDEKSDERVVESVLKSLKKNGVFVLDFMNSKKIISNLIPKETKTIQGIEFKIERLVESGFIVKKIAFSDKGKEFNYEEKVKILALPDFEKYFINAGLVIKSVFGNYNLNPFDQDHSDRLILLAKKK